MRRDANPLAAGPALPTDSAAARAVAVARAQGRVAVADALSLALCFADPSKAGEAPMEEGRKEPMRLARLGPARWSLAPWPFAVEELVLRYDGIRLAEDLRWEDEEAMRRDLREAPRTPLTETLVPG